MNTEFPFCVPVGRGPSPEGRGSRPAGRAALGIPGDACSRRRREQACHDGNLKCSVIWGIVRLNKNKTIPMTEQDKAKETMNKCRF